MITIDTKSFENLREIFKLIRRFGAKVQREHDASETMVKKHSRNRKSVSKEYRRHIKILNWALVIFCISILGIVLTPMIFINMDSKVLKTVVLVLVCIFIVWGYFFFKSYKSECLRGENKK